MNGATKINLDAVQKRIRRAAAKAHRLHNSAERGHDPKLQRAVVKAAGWTPYPVGKHRMRGTYWTTPGNLGVGESIDNAYIQARRQQRRDARKAAVKAGIVKVHCNKCGTNMQKHDRYKGKRSPLGYYGLVDATCSGGYFSDHLLDGLIYRFSLCERCLLEMFASFKKIPDVECYI